MKLTPLEKSQIVAQVNAEWTSARLAEDPNFDPLLHDAELWDRIEQRWEQAEAEKEIAAPGVGR
jgi:hypothetical protein